MRKSRIIGRGRRPSGPGPRVGIGSAIAAFLLVCGLILLFAGRGISCLTVDDRTLSRHVLRALQEAQQADHALQRRDYGTARQHIQRTQQRLTSALSEMGGGGAVGVEPVSVRGTTEVP